jgi:GNAT superfamily N-acetyltransferase
MQIAAALRDGDTTSHGDYELRYTHDVNGIGKGGRHFIEAHHPEDGQVGKLEWMGRPPYAIHDLKVNADHQRQGLATAMWNWSQDQARPKPTHSRDRTTMGDAWAKSVGGKLPRKSSVLDFFGVTAAIGEDDYAPDDGEYKQLWDRWHPRLQPDIHRHVALDLPSGHPAHDTSLPLHERAQAVMDHVSAGTGHRPDALGWHWTDDAKINFMTMGDRLGPGQTHAVIHAKTPPREHIEDNETTLREDRAVKDWDHREREVPLKRNAPVEVTGVSWRTHGGMVRHDFDEPITRTANHAAPSSRIFGPTFGLDHRLFIGESLKPEVRTAVLSRLGPVIEPLLGQTWEMYTKVYLAGSEASEWTSATLEGNGDFDTLIGIDYDHARAMHGPLKDLDDADITDMVNTALRAAYNASPWVAPFGGVWDLTGYVNANSYDITRIKPYAAYNISDDKWSVRPPHLPDWGLDKFPEGGENLIAEAEGYAAVVDAISKMPEPFQTQQGKALWHHLHADRGRAFSDEGEGWQDPGNALEKILVEWGVWDRLVEWQYGKQKTAATSGRIYSRGRMRLSDISFPGEGALSPRPYTQKQLAADIKRNGITDPIAIHTTRHPETGEWVHHTINGMHRIDAGRRAGVQDAPVVVSHPYEAEPPLIDRRDATEQEFNDAYDIERSGKWAMKTASYTEMDLACTAAWHTAVQSGALDLPQEQHDALTAEPYSAYKRKSLDLAKNPVEGTHVWRGEVRRGDPAESMRESGVGMHWTVNPDALLHPDTEHDEDRNIVWHGEVEHPKEQAIPRGHPMWRGQHQSLDSEAEIRFKPGAQVKIHGYWKKDPKHPDPGYLVPRFPERTGPGWSYHPVGEHATVSHRPRTDLIDYRDVGIQHEGVLAFFRTAEDEEDTSYRMQHRPPDDDYGAPLHDLSGGGLIPEDVYTHPHYYGDMSDSSVRDAHHVIQRMRGKPEGKVKIYRAVPAEYSNQGFRPGDWVTTSKDYAVLHGKHHEDPKNDWPVISTTVRAKELHTAGDDFREYGYNGEHKPWAMVSHKGGYNQEVRMNANGEIKPVQRRAPKTAMPAKNHPPTEGFSHEIHDLDWTDNDHGKQEEDWPGWNHKILYGKINGQHAGHITFSENPQGTAISVGKMETRDKHRGKGLASAMQDALAEEHPNHWINHGSRTGPGVRWWDSYEDPAEHRNIHNFPHDQWMDHFDIGREHDDPDRVFGENDRPAPEGGLKFEHVKGKEAHIAGVVKWRPPHGQEDHDTVHDKNNYEHDTRADILLNAASEQNAVGHGQFHDDHYDALDHAHAMVEEARKNHKGPITSFVMHKNEDDEYPSISIQSHQPGEELHTAGTQHLDTEYHYHPVHDRIARTAVRVLSFFRSAA